MILTKTQQREKELDERKKEYAQKVYHFFYEKTGVEIKGKVKRFINKYFVDDNQDLRNAEINGKLYVNFAQRTGKPIDVRFPSSLEPFFEVASRNIYFEPLSYKLKI